MNIFFDEMKAKIERQKHRKQSALNQNFQSVRLQAYLTICNENRRVRYHERSEELLSCGMQKKNRKGGNIGAFILVQEVFISLGIWCTSSTTAVSVSLKTDEMDEHRSPPQTPKALNPYRRVNHVSKYRQI